MWTSAIEWWDKSAVNKRALGNGNISKSFAHLFTALHIFSRTITEKLCMRFRSFTRHPMCVRVHRRYLCAKIHVFVHLKIIFMEFIFSHNFFVCSQKGNGFQLWFLFLLLLIFFFAKYLDKIYWHILNNWFFQSFAGKAAKSY